MTSVRTARVPRAIARLGMAAILVLVATGTQPLATEAVHPGTFANGALVYPVDDGLHLDYTTDEFNDLPDYTLPFGAGADALEFEQYGAWLAYSVPGGDEPGLYLADLARCTTRRLTQNAADRAPAFDFEHLYFTRGSGEPRAGLQRRGRADRSRLRDASRGGLRDRHGRGPPLPGQVRVCRAPVDRAPEPVRPDAR